MRRHAPDAALFDLDDTLTDRAASVDAFTPRFLAAFADALEPASRASITQSLIAADENGYASREAWARHTRESLRWRSPPPLRELIDVWMLQFPTCSIPRVGARATLEALRERGYRLGVITNGGSAVQRAKVAALGIESLLEALIISQEVKVAKPAREIFSLALERLSPTSGQAWFIGDNPLNDVWGATQAGLHAVWLPAAIPWPADLPAPEHSIAHLPDLLTLLP